jgi:hypothetical protein
MADDPNSSVFDQTGSDNNNNETGGNTGSDRPLDSQPQGGGTGDIPAEVADWVGEGKKFANMAELAKAYKHSQDFIEQLKTENNDMRRELSTAEKVDQLLSRIGGSSGEGAASGEGTSGETPPSDAGESEPSNEEKIRQAVEQEVTKLERERSAQQNEQDANDRVVKLADGNVQEAKNMLTRTAEDLGVSVSYLREQARTSPVALERLVKASQSGSSSSTSSSSAAQGSQNSEALASQNTRSSSGDVQPWSHWKKLRKEISKAEYYSPEVQNRIMRSRQELGEKFYDV